MLKYVFFIALILTASDSHAGLCKQWSSPKRVGALDTNFLNEASGFANSRLFPGRVYHHNDSGDGAYFYMTESDGSHTQKIEFDSGMPSDIEDMSIGQCAEGSCLYLGDIGDNNLKRSTLNLWIVPEKKAFTENRAAARLVVLAYPDGAHNAESMAVHPVSGDLYILTKEFSFDVRLAYPARLYKISSADLRNYTPGAMLLLTPVTQIDFPWLNYDFGMFGQEATSMDFSPSGKELLVLTYENVVEIKFESVLSGDSRSWSDGVDYSTYRMFGLLSQMEAVAYSLDGASFRVESEFNPNRGDAEASIFEVRCDKSSD